MRGFDLATGTVLWQHNVGSDVNVSPVVGAGLVVIMDRGGTATAFEASDGQHRWDREMQGAAGTVIGDSVVVIQDGQHRWDREMQGAAGTVIGDSVVVIQDQTAH